MKRIIKGLLIVGISVVVTGESIGRYYGLTSFPLFISSPDFEYISAPNQDVTIYRNRFVTNQYSQRSFFLQKTDTLVYLLIGDSVVYGGNSIDQDSLASTILETKLRRKTGRPVRVLNISSKSWGLDNAAAYLRKYGSFSADKVVLVVSSHDAYDNMTFKPIVGVDDSHPEQNAKLAWSKIIEKAWPVIRDKLRGNAVKVDTSGLTETRTFNSGFDSFRTLTDTLHIPLYVYFHKTTDEIQTNKFDKGGDEIRAYCQRHSIPLLDNNETPNLYEDYIHFNKSGQRFLSDRLYPVLLK